MPPGKPSQSIGAEPAIEVAVYPLSSAFMSAYVEPFLPRGPHSIELGDFSITAWIPFTFQGGDVTASLEVDAEINGITLDPPFSFAVEAKVGDFEEFLAGKGITAGGIEEEIEAALAPELGGVVDLAEQLLEDGLGAGEVICDLDISGDKLVMHTNVAGACIPVSTGGTITAP